MLTEYGVVVTAVITGFIGGIVAAEQKKRAKLHNVHGVKGTCVDAINEYCTCESHCRISSLNKPVYSSYGEGYLTCIHSIVYCSVSISGIDVQCG